MTHKHNIEGQPRGFFFAQSGRDEWSGESVELPKETMTAAIAGASALDPPPSPAALAQVVSAQGGSYFDPIVLPTSVQLLADGINLIADAPVAVTLGSSLSCQITTVLNSQDSGICYLIDGKTSVGIDTSFCSPRGNGGVAVKLAGSVDDIFVDISEISLGGDNAVGFFVGSTSPTPIDVNINTVVMDADNTCLIDFQPPSVTDIGSFDITTITESGTGGEIFTVRSGTLNVTAVVASAASVVTVEDGGRFSLDAHVASGSVLIESGGFAILKTIGLLLGDITVDVGGILEIICNRHVGVLTNNGELNGIINGITYGTYREKIEDSDTAETDPLKILRPDTLGGVQWGIVHPNDDGLLSAFSVATQAPVSTGSPLKVEFGAALAGTEVSLAVDGSVTINEDGQYTFKYLFQPGRATNGGIANLFFHQEVDGVQEGDSVFTKLNGVNDDLPIYFISDPLDLLQGQVVDMYFLRSVGGVNEGSLMAESPSQAGWTSSNSASITVTRGKNE